MDLFVVGRNDAQPHQWEFIGVFDDVGLAIAACKTDQHCVCPVKLNENCESGMSWPGAWFPKIQERPHA